MMYTPQEKRYEYWNHFVENFFVFGEGGGSGVTGPRLRKIKKYIIRDDNFWADVVIRHGGLDQTPNEMRLYDRDQYDHCQGNFWGMINQTLVEQGLVHRWQLGLD